MRSLRWAFHTYSTFDQPPVTDLVQLPEHRSVRVLEDNAALAARVRPLTVRPTEFLQLDIGGGDSNTLNALFRKPDVYHVGIAVVPKPQPQYYNAEYQEIFMRTPQDNPEGYRTCAPINYAEGLRGDLLIITGTGETNTHVEITEGLVDRLIELGKRIGLMIFSSDRDFTLWPEPGTKLTLDLDGTSLRLPVVGGPNWFEEAVGQG